jgi:hypothetical protein
VHLRGDHLRDRLGTSHYLFGGAEKDVDAFSNQTMLFMVLAPIWVPLLIVAVIGQCRGLVAAIGHRIRTKPVDILLASVDEPFYVQEARSRVEQYSQAPENERREDRHTRLMRLEYYKRCLR